MKSILLPTDFSNNAWNAAFCALKMYRDVRCHFFILNAYGPHQANVLGGRSKESTGVVHESKEKSSNEELSKMMDYFRKHHSNPKHTFEVISESGNVVDAVKNMLLEKDINLILMGTKGATGAKEIFMGSNTVKLIKAIRNRPIIAVPDTYDFQALKQLVFPTDFTRFFNKFELLPLVGLALLWKTKIQILHVAQEFLLNDEQKANKDILKERLKDLEHVFNKVDIHTTVANAIGEFALESNADMVALIHYQHTFLEKLTQEPVVKKVGFHSKVPLLVLPELP